MQPSWLNVRSLCLKVQRLSRLGHNRELARRSALDLDARSTDHDSQS